MPEKLRKLVPATLLFLFSACGSIAPPPQTSSSEEIFSSSEEASLFWNVDEVDISRVNGDGKLIAFTFDDGPSRTLENILAVFADFNERSVFPATATVFCNGIRCTAQSEQALHTALALGWELGNHGYSHTDFTALSENEYQREIQENDLLLERIDGNSIHLLRAPFGRINEQVKALATAPLIDWTVDTLDWTGASAESIYSAVWQGKFSGAIVLFHDGYEHTVSALKLLLPDLAEEGYQVVSVSQLIKAHGCALRKGGVYIRVRKQSKAYFAS